MITNERIAVTVYCTVHEVEETFVESLARAGLIELIEEQQQHFLAFETLPQLEKYITWHYELDVNTSGIEVIQHLLERLARTESELRELRGHVR